MQQDPLIPHELDTHERIAMYWLRTLAGFGLVCLLAIIAWILVYGVRLIPKAGDGIASVFSSVFSKAPVASLAFSLPERSISDGKETVFRWNYTETTSSASPTVYQFSYSCSVKGLSVQVRQQGNLVPLTCETPFPLTNAREVAVVAMLPDRGFEDITFTIHAGTLSDSTVVTILNTNIHDVAPLATTTATTTQTKKPIVSQTYTVTPIPTPAPVTITPLPRQTTLLYDGLPADLVLEILDTGIKDNGTYYPVSPIPSNKTAAVRFAVTNRGGAVSGAWFFTAYLPIQGDSSYKYVSNVQPAMYPLARTEFTLTFDEVLRASEGTIRIVLSPAQNSDNRDNNDSSVTVTIRK